MVVLDPEGDPADTTLNSDTWIVRPMRRQTRVIHHEPLGEITTPIEEARWFMPTMTIAALLTLLLLVAA